MIIISPYSKQMRNGKAHPKNYPWWSDVLARVDEDIIQIGIDGEEPLTPDFRKNLEFSELAKLAQQCKTWMSCDSFFQHFCWDLKKPGIVLWGQSDPIIFGHPENLNLLKDRKYLRDKQFWLWEQATFNEDAFVKPDVVIKALRQFHVKIKK